MRERASVEEIAGLSEIETRKKSKLERLAKFLKNLTLAAGVVGALESQGLLSQKVEAQERFTLSEAQKSLLTEAFGSPNPFFTSSVVSITEDNYPDGARIRESTLVDDKLPSIESIETIEGKLSEYLITKILFETYPKGWVHGEISSIKIQSEDEYQKVFGKKPTLIIAEKPTSIVAYVRSRKGEIKDNMVFIEEEGRKMNFEQFITTLSHEIAHTNDFASDNETFPEEGDELALLLYGRIRDANRYQSYYVENINGKNPYIVNQRRVTEYWSEICAQYFDDADKLSIEDVMLVETVIKRTDPDFNWQEAKLKRDQLIEEARNANYNKR